MLLNARLHEKLIHVNKRGHWSYVPIGTIANNLDSFGTILYIQIWTALAYLQFIVFHYDRIQIDSSIWVIVASSMTCKSDLRLRVWRDSQITQ